MAEFWRRRPVIHAMTYEGDLAALSSWVAEVVAAVACTSINNATVVPLDEGGFRVLWDEGYLGAETLQTEGSTGDVLAIEGCWFYVHSQADFESFFEPRS